MAAVLLPGQRTPALHSLTSDSPTILRFVDRLRRDGPVTCCYEAGPCGFELQRALTGRDIPCDVIAPALIPRRAGDRIKTDRRDAGHLAVLYRAGALTAIHIPTEHEEAARDLLRCREDIRADLLRARVLRQKPSRLAADASQANAVTILQEGTRDPHARSPRAGMVVGRQHRVDGQRCPSGCTSFVAMM